MSEEVPMDKPVYSLVPTDTAGFDSLAELALNMRWSWNHATDEVWRRLEPELWEVTHNPWVVLQTVSRERIGRVLADPGFRKSVDELVQTRRRALEAPAWFQQQHSDSPLKCVAYFCMEFPTAPSITQRCAQHVQRRTSRCASCLSAPEWLCRWSRLEFYGNDDGGHS